MKILVLSVALLAASGRMRADEPTTISDQGNALSRSKSAEQLTPPPPEPKISHPAPVVITVAVPVPPAAQIAVISPPLVTAAPVPDAATKEERVVVTKVIPVKERPAWPWRAAVFGLTGACVLLLLRGRR